MTVKQTVARSDLDSACTLHVCSWGLMGTWGGSWGFVGPWYLERNPAKGFKPGEKGSQNQLIGFGSLLHSSHQHLWSNQPNLDANGL
jgi:hypothetical protein